MTKPGLKKSKKYPQKRKEDLYLLKEENNRKYDLEELNLIFGAIRRKTEAKL